MIRELIEHHLLDHDFGLILFGYHLPITSHSVLMFLISIILLVFIPLAWKMNWRFCRTAIESFVVFVRDGIVLPNLGEEGRRLVPFFCTLLIFLLFANYFGMVPGGKTITSNISITGGMALVSFFVIVSLSVRQNGLLGFIKTFIPSGVPKWLIPLLFPIEVLGLLIKTFVLAVRLFANMTAGHVVLIALFSFIFVMGQSSILAGYGTAAPILGMTIFVSILELLVAAIQAYVFTLLTAIFAGLQMHEH